MGAKELQPRRPEIPTHHDPLEGRPSPSPHNPPGQLSPYRGEAASSKRRENRSRGFPPNCVSAEEGRTFVGRQELTDSEPKVSHQGGNLEGSRCSGVQSLSLRRL